MKQSLLLASFLGGLALLPAIALAQSTSSSGPEGVRSPTPPSATYPGSPNANASTATDPYGRGTVIVVAPVIPEDADGDGRISRSEFTMGPTLALQQEKDANKTEKEKSDLNLRERTNTVELFNDLDKDKDGFLTGSELPTHATSKATGPKR